MRTPDKNMQQVRGSCSQGQLEVLHALLGDKCRGDVGAGCLQGHKAALHALLSDGCSGNEDGSIEAQERCASKISENNRQVFGPCLQVAHTGTTQRGMLLCLMECSVGSWVC